MLITLYAQTEHKCECTNQWYSGVFLELNGVRLRNNSLVDIDDIPDQVTVGFLTAAANALMCRTDLVACCNAGLQGLPQNVGDWYHPDGSIVVFGGKSTPFRRNRNQSVINLWRNNNPIERGHFRCELPDAQNVNQTRYVNICELSH